MGVLLKRIFFGFPFFVLASLIAFSFFQHPCSDDFTGNYLAKTMGYREATWYYLWHENGRFSSVPVFIFFTQFRFILDHYYTGLIFFLCVTYLSLFFFIKYIARTFYDTTRGIAYCHWLTAFSMLVLLICMPEPSSFFSWLATDTTYLLSFLFFLFYLVKLHQVLQTRAVAGNKVSNFVILGLIILVLGGANEVSLFFSFFFFLVIFGYNLFLLKRKNRDLYIVLCMHVLTILLVLWMPGNGRRSGGYTPKQFFLFSAAGALYQLFQVAFGIFSSPVFWLAVCLALCGSKHLKEPVKNSFRDKRLAPGIALLVLFSAIFVFCFIIRQVGGVVLPPRTKNIIVCITVPALLLIAIMNGERLPSLVSFAGEKEKRGNLLLFFGTIVLLFNPFMVGMLQSAIDAPVHHDIMNRRIALVRQARDAGHQKVVFRPYGEMFSEVLAKKYGTKTAAFLQAEFPSPPEMLYFRDDAASPFMAPFYIEYYGIDSLQLNDHISVRFGLTPAKRPAGVAEEDKIRANY